MCGLLLLASSSAADIQAAARCKENRTVTTDPLYCQSKQKLDRKTNDKKVKLNPPYEVRITILSKLKCVKSILSIELC